MAVARPRLKLGAFPPGGLEQVLVLNRFIATVGSRRRVLARESHRPTRRRAPTSRIERVRALLPAVSGIGIAAIAGWLLAGGRLPSEQMLLGQFEPLAEESSASGAPVRFDTTPSGASVGIDGTSRGKTPLDVHLEPGQHALSLEQSDSLGAAQQFATHGPTCARTPLGPRCSKTSTCLA
jgi:hypothetical protein